MHKKHATLIKAWLEGATVYYRYPGNGIWKLANQEDPGFFPDIEYYVEPEKKNCRNKVALMCDENGNTRFAIASTDKMMYKLSGMKDFVKWVGEITFNNKQVTFYETL